MKCNKSTVVRNQAISTKVYFDTTVVWNQATDEAVRLYMSDNFTASDEYILGTRLLVILKSMIE